MEEEGVSGRKRSVQNPKEIEGEIQLPPRFVQVPHPPGSGFPPTAPAGPTSTTKSISAMASNVLLAVTIVVINAGGPLGPLRSGGGGDGGDCEMLVP